MDTKKNRLYRVSENSIISIGQITTIVKDSVTFFDETKLKCGRVDQSSTKIRLEDGRIASLFF
jgi:hypothetical protein